MAYGDIKTLYTTKLDSGYIEVRAQEYKTVCVFTYWGYLDNGHLIGYSKNLNTIKKRINKYLKGK